MLINEELRELVGKYLDEGLASKENFSNDIEILRAVIYAEADAANFYSQLILKAKDKRVKELLADISKEEDIHLYEAKTMLEKLYPNIDSIIKGAEKEVEDKFL